MKKTFSWAALVLAVAGLIVAGCETGPVLVNATPTPAIQSQAPPQLPGRILLVKSGDLWVLQGGSFTRLTQVGNLRQARWSPAPAEGGPGGQYIAYVEVGENGSDILVRPAAGGATQELTHNRALPRENAAWTFRPVWSPPSTSPQIAYLSDAGTNDLQLWVMTTAGKNPHQVATVSGLYGGIIGLDWSPDGKTMLLAAYRESAKSQIWQFDLATGSWKQVTNEKDGAYDPAWSPDGQHIAYTVRREGRHDIWVSRSDGSQASPITAAGACRAPAWAPDGGMIAYLSNPTGSFDLWVTDVGFNTDGSATPANHQQVTQGAHLDPDSGLSWVR